MSKENNNLYDACLAIKAAILMGVERITETQAQSAAMVYKANPEKFLLAFDYIYREYKNSRLLRNRDIPGFLKSKGL